MLLGVIGSSRKLEVVSRLMSKNPKIPGQTRIRNARTNHVSHPSLQPTRTFNSEAKTAREAEEESGRANYDFIAIGQESPSPDALSFSDITDNKKQFKKSAVAKAVRQMRAGFFSTKESVPTGMCPVGIHVHLKKVILEALHNMDESGDLHPHCWQQTDVSLKPSTSSPFLTGAHFTRHPSPLSRCCCLTLTGS